MNLIPGNSTDTGNYFCTWDSQCDAMYARNPSAESIPCRDAMCEEFLFGEDGLLKSFDGIRGDLIAVLDDGWDVPYGAVDPRIFGSLEADTDRFPSLRGLDPAERLKELSGRIRALGYRGPGLWIPTQTPSIVNRREVLLTPQEERLYWEERAKWCREAGVIYWKADWGAHQGDADYCIMMTECARKFAPGLKIEHGFAGFPKLESDENGHEVSEKLKAYLKKVLPACDYLRTYDVVHELKYASTVDRVSICLEAAQGVSGPCAVLNIEDTALIGAALGCSIGVMRHDFEKKRKYVPLPPRLVSETVCALRWQRIAPPFEANRGELHISGERMKDVWHCPERAANLWPSLPEGEYYVTAPAAVSRNMPLPEVIAPGEKPYVLCSVNPDTGALCAAVTRRTFGDRIDITPPAEVRLKGRAISAPIGLFGRFGAVSVAFNEPVNDCRVFVQNLLSCSAEDVTDSVILSDKCLTVPGEVLLKIGNPEDPINGIPGVVIQIL